MMSEDTKMDELATSGVQFHASPTESGSTGKASATAKVIINVDQVQEFRPPKRDAEQLAAHKNAQLPSFDPWELTDLVDDSPSWSELDTIGRVKLVCIGYVGKLVALLTLLYLFVCSLDVMASAFRLLGGKAAGGAFSNSEIVSNPVAGLMIGVLATVLVQSSSTSTSVVVSMVAAGILEVKPAIPIVMGANIGTSMTNTIVSLAHYTNKNEFRRSFGGATVHDMFNWLTVIVLLPIEIITGLLYWFTNWIVTPLESADGGGAKLKLLKVITKPFTSLIIQVDKKVISKLAKNVSLAADPSIRLLKVWCEEKAPKVAANMTTAAPRKVKCDFLFNNFDLNDSWNGIISLAVSLLALCVCLVLIVKLLHSLMRGKIATVIKKTMNSHFPGKLAFLTGYVAMLVGAGMTILVQSSSIFTSTMTPLVGIGALRLERMYPLTLGSNIGTTFTGVLAALAASGTKKEFQSALQIALCHLFFNILGIIIYYPVPIMRWPIGLAKSLGNTTAKYRWFAILYLVLMFFLAPALIFGLSMIHNAVAIAFTVLVVLICVVVIMIKKLQRKKPEWLPKRLRDWTFLPLCLRSLEPADRLITSALSLCPCCKRCGASGEHKVTTFHEDDGSTPYMSSAVTTATTGPVTPHPEANHEAEQKDEEQTAERNFTTSF